MKEFKINCSSIWEIMTNPKSKTKPLSDTCETFLEKWQLGQDYQKRKSFTSKYTKKGNDCEEGSLLEIAKFLGIPESLAIKETTPKENRFLIGTCDMKYEGCIIDAKNSYECFTFPKYKKEPKIEYWWQVQGYMELYGLKKAKICHILSDAPESIIWAEARKKAWEKDEEVTEELYQVVKIEMTYSHFPLEQRIKVFNVDYDADAIEKIKNRVLECRQFLEHLTGA